MNGEKIKPEKNLGEDIKPEKKLDQQPPKITPIAPTGKDINPMDDGYQEKIRKRFW